MHQLARELTPPVSSGRSSAVRRPLRGRLGGRRIPGRRPAGERSLGAHERQLRVGEGDLVPKLRDSRFGEVLLALRVGQAFAKEVIVLHELGHELVERAGTSELRRTLGVGVDGDD